MKSTWMKKLFLIIMAMAAFSCGDTINDIYDDLDARVPICVDSGIAVSGDGRGWAHAFRTIQEAVDAAGEGDDIWVKAGTCDPVTVIKSVSIYGGFDGTEERLSQRDPTVNITAIAVTSDGVTGMTVGDPAEKVLLDGVSFTNDGSYSSSGGVNVTGPSGSVIEITVKNCTFSNMTQNPGGAVSLENAFGHIQDCNFNSNSSSNGGAVYIYDSGLYITGSYFSGNTSPGNGGALCLEGSGTVVVEGSTFTGNSAAYGGAVRAECSYLTLRGGSIFHGNSASNGGALSFKSIEECSIAGCDFISNTSTIFGGVLHLTDTVLAIEGSLFSSNSAGSSGGSLYMFRTAADTIVSASRTIFSGNTTLDSDSGGGGAVNCVSGELNIRRCLFDNNSTARIGGGLFIGSNIEATVTDSVFSNNRATGAGWGGAIMLWAGAGHNLINLSFYGNLAVQGGAVYTNTASHLIINSVFYGNSASSYGNNILMDDSDTLVPVRCFFDNGLYVNGGGAIDSSGSIVNTTDVPFVSVDSGSPYYLYPAEIIRDEGTSDAGNLPSGFVIPSTDMAGNSRIRGSGIDIGAYEWQ